MKRKRITLSEVASAAGCSVAVASRALSTDLLQNRTVAEATAASVVAAARKLGYFPHRSFAHRRAVGVVGVFLPASRSEMMLELMDGVTAAARKANTPVHIYTNASAASFREFMQCYGDSSRSIGAIGYYPPAACNVPDFLAMHEQLDKRGAPLVIVHNNAPENFPAPQVRIDNFHAGVLAGEYLAGLRCREYLALGTDKGYRYQRIEGFRSSLAQCGRGAAVLLGGADEGDLDMEKSLLLARQIERMIDWQAPEPVGIFADSGLLALFMHNYFQSRGIAVGRRLRLVGCDDETFSEAAYPALTSIRQPFREMGEVAMRKLFNLMKGGCETSTVLKPELIVRGT